MLGKYNSIGRVSDCGSGSFWFEPRYLPYLWDVSVKHTPRNIYNQIALFQQIHLLCLALIKNISTQEALKTYNSYKVYFTYVAKNFVHVPTSTVWSAISVASPLSMPFKVQRKPNLPIRKLVLKDPLFSAFLTVNTFFSQYYLTPHSTFRKFYIYNKQNNVGVWNLRRLFLCWQRILFLLYHLFYFDLKYLVFTSSYFRYESLALNYQVIKRIQSIWRYATPFIFFINNKTKTENAVYFNLLKRLNAHVFFIIDPIYHKGTLHYCSKHKFITIGPVAISADFYTLDYAIPVSTNSVFSNLFCLRLLFRVESETKLYKFNALN